MALVINPEQSIRARQMVNSPLIPSLTKTDRSNFLLVGSGLRDLMNDTHLAVKDRCFRAGVKAAGSVILDLPRALTCCTVEGLGLSQFEAEIETVHVPQWVNCL